MVNKQPQETTLAAAQAALPSLLFLKEHEAELFASLKTVKEANDSGLLRTVTGYDKVVPTPDGSAIAAVQSHIEFLSFGDEPLPIEGKPVLQWAAELEGRVASSMRALLKEAWTSYSHADLETLADKFPSQISCLVLNLRITSEGEKALSRGDVKKLKAALEDIERAIGNSSRAMRKDLNAFVKMRLRNLQVTALGFRRKLLRMVKTIESGASFQDTWALWRSFLRAYYDEKDGLLVTMECGEGAVPYGFSFDGSNLLVETDLTHKVYNDTMGSLVPNHKSHRTVFCWGPAGTGKTETQRSLVTTLGYRSVVYNGRDRIADNYERMLAASKSNPRCVMVIDEVNRIGSAQEIMSYLSAVQRVSRENRPLFQSYTFNPGYKPNGKDPVFELQHILSRGSVSIPMARPDLAVICQAMLCAEGFVFHDKLGAKVSAYYAWCKENLSKQPHYDFGLRNIKASISTAGYYLRKTFNPDCACEIQCVMDAVRMNIMPRMGDADVPLAEAQLAKVLEDGHARSWESMLTDSKMREVVVDGAEDEAVRNRLCQLLATQEIRHGSCALTANPEATFKGVEECARALGYDLEHLDLSGDKFTVEHVLGKFLNPVADSKVDDASESWEEVSKGTWKDGVLAAALRSGSSEEGKRKWIVITGTDCTEENTVGGGIWSRFHSLLDDNKFLALPTGERVALHRDARIVFVLPSLKNATPALVSRMGVVNFGVQPNGAGCALM